LPKITLLKLAPLQMPTPITLHLDFAQDIKALYQLAKSDVLLVEPLGRLQSNEELTPIGVHARVGHRQNSCFVVRDRERLVREFTPVD